MEYFVPRKAFSHEHVLRFSINNHHQKPHELWVYGSAHAVLRLPEDLHAFYRDNEAILVVLRLHKVRTLHILPQEKRQNTSLIQIRYKRTKIQGARYLQRVYLMIRGISLTNLASNNAQDIAILSLKPPPEVSKEASKNAVEETSSREQTSLRLILS